MRTTKIWTYGMKHRPFGIGCQPEAGLKNVVSSVPMIEQKNKTGFWSVLKYDRELTQKEIYDFELVFISSGDEVI